MGRQRIRPPKLIIDTLHSAVKECDIQIFGNVPVEAQQIRPNIGILGFVDK